MSRRSSRSCSGERPLRVHVAAHVPELPEVAAALVGGILAPQQLARELVVESHHVCFDELLIRLEQRDAVRRNEIQVREKELAADAHERPEHRRVDDRVVHHLAQRSGGLTAHARWKLDDPPDTRRNRHDGIQRHDGRGCRRGDAERGSLRLGRNSFAQCGDVGDVAHRLLESNRVGTVRVTAGCCRRRGGIEHESRGRRHRVDRGNRLILLGNARATFLSCRKWRKPRAQRKARRKDDDPSTNPSRAEERPAKAKR